jgi:hypothetical protein
MTMLKECKTFRGEDGLLALECAERLRKTEPLVWCYYIADEFDYDDRGGIWIVEAYHWVFSNHPLAGLARMLGAA